MRRLLNYLGHSLPARLLAIFVLTASIFLIVTTIMWGVGMRHQWKTRIHPHMLQYVDYLNQDIGTPPNLERALQISDALPIAIHIVGPDVDFTSTDQPFNADDIDFENPRRFKNLKNINTRSGRHYDQGEYRDRIVFRSQIDEYTVYFDLRHRGEPQSQLNRHKNHFKKGKRGVHILFFTLTTLLLVLLLCHWLIRRLISPIGDIQTGVQAMGAGALDYRIPVRRNDDLGELTHSINDMAGDIEDMLDAKRQLLLAISHELRSPITRARVSTQLLPESDSRERIEDDLKEMEALITELLESERLNSPHAALARSPVMLRTVIDDVIKESFDHNINVVADGPQHAVLLDEARVRMLIRNLVSNAVHHAASEKVDITVACQQDGATIVITDDGVGIAADQIARLTEPFHRVDASRTRSTGGFGLGLYLCRLIAEAHNGSLEIDSKVGEGTTVTVILRQPESSEPV